ncbi:MULTISPECIES: DUF6973 domain-containing protein [Amycolatopsis]|uniref:DUF6973 domain-containing protein n=1 Tax=Amycolatopsis TaxID=1813 RepID=UPI000B8AC675|nr:MULTISPECIES: hypothetical protein [Amycolatopsis]OXM72494.1 hypothetical protein CF166_15625 [Amycolatopsis sp. KNN50.9b]
MGEATSGGGGTATAPRNDAPASTPESAETRQGAGEQNGGSPPAGEPASDRPAAENTPAGENTPGAEQRDSTGRPDESTVDGAEKTGGVAGDILTDVPPPDPQPVQAAHDGWAPVAERADQTGEEARAGTRELPGAWRDGSGAAMSERAESTLRETDEVAQDARTVTGTLATIRDDYARTRTDMENVARQADTDAGLAHATMGPGPETDLATERVKQTARETNLRLRTETARNADAAWANVRLAGAEQPPGTGDAGQPAPEPGGPVPDAARELDDAQRALDQAARSDVVANLPTPPTDEELLRGYQTGDDRMLPILGEKLTPSELWASTREDITGIPLLDAMVVNPQNTIRHLGVKEEAETAGEQSFPDPDGPGPEGGRAGTGENHRDAFRHAYWNALMTREFGENSAEQVGTGHERRPEDPVDKQPPLFAERQEAMDLYNNSIGRRIATELGPQATDADVRAVIEQAIRDGKLVVFNQDHTGLVPSGGAEDFPR